MGFFSALCPGCGHSIRSRWCVRPASEWMKQAVSFTKRKTHTGGSVYVARIGEYDGYGRIAGVQVVPFDRRASLYHEACWKILGAQPGLEWTPEKSKHAQDQGYFVGEYDPSQPKTLQDLEALRRIAERMEQRNQSTPIEVRTCKHLRGYLGEAHEAARCQQHPIQPDLFPTAPPAPTTAPGLLLAEKWEGQDPTGWLMSEKLDGVRAYWDGKRFLSRGKGKQYLAPDWFTSGFPEVPLDGELWGGRKKFDEVSGIVRREDRGEGWRGLLYVIFDAPQAEGGFERRLAFAQGLLGIAPPVHAIVLQHSACRDLDHMMEELRRVEALGGEGIMLRQSGSLYVQRRSTTLLKVKTFHDTEGLVIGHQPGKGRHVGRLGALQVRLANGVECEVGTGFSDRQRENPPPIGTVITFRFQELNPKSGVPRFPSYVGVRGDMEG